MSGEKEAPRPHFMPSASPATAGEDKWRRLFYGLTGLTVLIFLKDAFLVPGTVEYARFTIQDDARQFLAWMPRIGAPVEGDLLAEYWRSASPAAFRLIYEAFAAIGVAPTVLARLIPPVLLAVSAWAAWRVAMRMTGGRPAAAFVAAAFVMALLIHEDSIWSATPRAFSPPLFLIFLDGLLRGRAVQIVVALFALAALYPTTALVGLTMLGLSKLRLRPRPGIDLSRGSVLLVAAATIAVAVPVLALPGQTSRWEPVLTVEQATAMPNLGSPDGRSSIVNEDGSVGWVCSARMGFVPEMVPCWSTPWAGALNLVILLPLIVLAARAARGPLHQPAAGPPPRSGEEWDANLSYLWALVAGLAWWAVAVAFAFKLHLPSRYPQRVLSILEWLAIGQLIGLWLTAKWPKRGTRIAAGILGVAFLVSFFTPTPGLRRPDDPEAMARLAALPGEARVAGLADDLNAAPALAGVTVLATVEHAIPYHWGYFEEVDRRLRAMVRAAATSDEGELARFLEKEQVDVFVVDRDLIERGDVPDAYASVIPVAVREAEARMRERPSALQLRARGCSVHWGQTVLLDASCLEREPNR